MMPSVRVIGGMSEAINRTYWMVYLPVGSTDIPSKILVNVDVRPRD
jgi:hypothetical protein